MDRCIEDIKAIIKKCEEFTRQYGAEIEVNVVDYKQDCGLPIYGVTMSDE